MIITSGLSQLGSSNIGQSVIGKDGLVFPVLGIASTGTCLFPNACLFSLPLDRLELTATRKNETSVELNWEAAFYPQNKGFEIQRSDGNSFNFKPVRFIIPQNTGNSATVNYLQIDWNMYPNRSYYRLKQEDFSGRLIYSNMAVVNGNKQAGSLSIFPVPAQNKCTIQIPGTGISNMEVNALVKNISGNIILQKKLRAVQNKIELMQLNFLPAGFYLLTIMLPETEFSGKLIISR
jgi:hypothetical protein